MYRLCPVAAGLVRIFRSSTLQRPGERISLPHAINLRLCARSSHVLHELADRLGAPPVNRLENLLNPLRRRGTWFAQELGGIFNGPRALVFQHHRRGVERGIGHDPDVVLLLAINGDGNVQDILSRPCSCSCRGSCCGCCGCCCGCCGWWRCIF